MRLTSFSVQNYRGFADRTEVELRPLTLLFGYNSAGKSALLRWLPIWRPRWSVARLRRWSSITTLLAEHRSTTSCRATRAATS